MTKNQVEKSKTKVTRKITKDKDGTIQIIYTIPFNLIKKTRNKVAEEIGKNIEVPGFRKGKAPISKVIEHVPDHTLIEEILGRILPEIVGKTIKEEKLKIAIYPKFELISAKEKEDWQIKATTCELPEIEIGDYKKNIIEASTSKTIWTPDKANEDLKDKKLTKEEKEQLAIKNLVETAKVKIPQLIIEEEANSRLSRLLERLEKLGLSLEQYLASIGKTAGNLRKDYEKQAREAIILDLALEKVAEKENIKIESSEVENAIKASQADPGLNKKLNTPQQKRIIENVLRKRAALEKLISYF
jgi:FKBP-type peptidyl-prolyl cis-trans isomerase (trigger factor)